MSEAITDLVLMESWRQERAALQQKLSRLQTGDGGRTLRFSQKLSSVCQLMHTIAKYDVFIEEYRRGAGALPRFGLTSSRTGEAQHPASFGVL